MKYAISTSYADAMNELHATMTRVANVLDAHLQNEMLSTLLLKDIILELLDIESRYESAEKGINKCIDNIRATHKMPVIDSRLQDENMHIINRIISDTIPALNADLDRLMRKYDGLMKHIGCPV